MKTSAGYKHSQVLWLGIALAQFWLLTVAQGSTSRLVSATDPAFGPAAGGGGDSYLPAVSRDGRYVLFGSTAQNLVTNRTVPALFPAPINVYLRDRTIGSTVLVSVNLNGTGGGDDNSLPIGVSTNGRYALFQSSASNLVAGDTNNAADVFVRDLVDGTTRLVSVSANGGFANLPSYSSVMTPDGRYVAFVSAADNLAPNDTNGIADVFVRDMVSNVTSVASLGALPGISVHLGLGNYLYQGSDTPVMTPDGRYIAFYSSATNLAPGAGTIADVYLRDQKMGTTTWVSAGAMPALQSLATVSNAVSFSHTISDDGRFVAFEAVAYSELFPRVRLSPGIILRYDTQTGQTLLIETNAAVPVTSSFENVEDLSLASDGRFIAYVANALDTSSTTTAIRVWDAQSGTSTLVSGDTNNSVLAGFRSDSPVISDDGRFVAFTSTAPDPRTNGSPGDFHIYLRDLLTATTTLVDADTNIADSLIDPSTTPAMSADGRLIAFYRQDGSLAPSHGNHPYDVFARDLQTTNTELISVHDPNLPSQTPDGASAISSSSLSSNARFIAFWSDADDLVPNDTNGLRDVFVYDALNTTNILVSVNTNGVAGDGYSTDCALSADGRYVAFTSFADDLVPGDTNRALDVFVRDLQVGTTILVSVNMDGTGPGNADSYSPLLSSNGQVVVFHSKANNVRPGLGFVSGFDNLFWKDLKSNATYALTTNQYADQVIAVSMTPDGSLVALAKVNSNNNPLSPPSKLFIWDSGSAAIVYTLTGSIDSFGPLAISPNGQKFVYVTNSAGTSQLVAMDRISNTNWVIASYVGYSASAPRFSGDSRFLSYVASLGSAAYTNQVFLYDFQTGTNLLVSQSSDGVSPGNNHSDSPDINSDGTFVSYRSAASNLISGYTNEVPGIFLYDRSSASNKLITASRFGGRGADNRSFLPVFSGDGHTLVFESWASDLIPNDFNNKNDVFALGLDSGTTLSSFEVSVFPAAGSPLSNWLSWPVVPGKTYRVQFKKNLNDEAWQDLNGQMSIIGDRGYLKDPTPVTTERFYRIVGF
jgi:hypothetical protein